MSISHFQNVTVPYRRSLPFCMLAPSVSDEAWSAKQGMEQASDKAVKSK